MLLMIYRTYGDGQPALMSLNRNFTDEEFVQFVGRVAQVTKALGRSGYEPAALTIQVISVDSGTAVALGEFEA